MDTLKCSRNSEAYHRQTLYTYAAEHAHYYTIQDESLRHRLLDLRTEQQSYHGFPASNILHMDHLLARKLIEVRYCLDLKPLCARRLVKWRDESLMLSGCFDGLENGRAGGIVWIHIPYTAEKHNTIAALGWSEFLDRQTRMYIEHLMLISGSHDAMLTMSDGTFARTLSHEYETGTADRFALLDHYVAFERELKALQISKWHNQ